MARYNGPVCKQCRRENAKLFLKGEKCASAKCPFDKRPYAPGHQGEGRRIRVSEYGLRLREKQKARRIYGIGERQFRKYFETAKTTKGNTGGNLLSLLERRIDNVLWRMAITRSRSEARQLVRNGLLKINGQKVDIPSFLVKNGDIVTFKEKHGENIKKTKEVLKDRELPAWLSFDDDKLEGSVLSMPKREDIDALIAEHLIVEFYSR